jgi:PST family polysaccharide transporter
MLRWAMISAPLTVAAFVIGVRWGIVGLAASFSVSWCLGHYVFIVMACRGSPVRQIDIGRALLAPIVASLAGLAAGMSALSLLVVTGFSPIGRTALVLPAICAVYAGVLWWIPASRAQVGRMLRSRLRLAALSGRKDV